MQLLKESKKTESTIDLHIVALFEDQKNTSPEFQEILKKSTFLTGKFQEVECIRFAKENAHLLVVGMGKTSDLDSEKMRNLGGRVFSEIKKFSKKGALVHAQSFSAKKTKVNALTCFLEGMTMSDYEFTKYMTKKDEAKKAEIYVFSKLASDQKKLGTLVDQMNAVRDAVNVTRDWSNEPSNVGTPEYFANEAKKWAQKYKLKYRVINDAEAKKLKMDLYLSVGKGSKLPSKVVVLEYTPSKKSKKTIALVGKGVTFDTGGTSLKPSPGMEEMKHDMTGAATVFGATILAAATKCPHKVITYMAFTENKIGEYATNPGDIVKARNGKTVEILNTDAEGRLVLADVIDLAQDQKPDVLIDVATLTGAVIIALGKHAAGIMSNDDKVAQKFMNLGSENGERMWQLPIYQEHMDEMKSKYADLANIGPDREAGTIRGGAFLAHFIREKTKWIHLDIAATSWNQGHKSYNPKRGGSGTYVRTLSDFVSKL